MRFWFTIGSLFCLSVGFSQVDNVGSGRALLLSGINQYVTFGNVYDDLALPVSISAWVKVPSGVTYALPIFNSQDNLPIYNGLTFIVTPTSLSIQYGDGRGEGLSDFRRGKGVYINDISNRWVHVAANMRGPMDMDLFINGVNVGGFYVGDSPFSMSSASPGDVAKLGYWHSNGSTFLFEGQIDEVRIWNKSLTQNEIRDKMCSSLNGSESGLIGYWTFDEITGNTVYDKSPNQFHGTLVGNPQRIFSGAPIGDESKFTYPTGWTNVSLSLSGGAHTLSASNITGNPWGIHIYRVDNTPSQANGLNLAQIQIPYFGVFMASDFTSGGFQANYISAANCPVKVRSDNSISTWMDAGTTFINRAEIIKGIDGLVPIANLGQDELICDESDRILNAVTDPTNKTFLWSTGETTPTINITTSGSYWVNVSQNCQVDRDTVKITLLQTPTPFNLGQDLVTCEVVDLDLTVPNNDGDKILWSTGSNQSFIHITGFGQFWVEVKNACGAARDTITFMPLILKVDKIPNVITPNGDDKNEFFVVEKPLEGSNLVIFDRWGKLVFESLAYNNSWNGSGLSSGVYFWRAEGLCINEAKGTISIVR
jgi:gliding motility-associated-like protein